jgi:hypothetical protein
MYKYCVARGFKSTVMSRLQEIFIGMFLWAFSYFVLVLFNWHALFTCRSASAASQGNTTSCAQLSVIATDQSFGFFYAAFVYSFLLVLTGMVGTQVRAVACALQPRLPYLCQVLEFAKDFEQLKEFRDFLEIRLGVPDEQVATIEWSEIVNLLVRKQSQHRLFIQEDVQQFDILARICREDNYIVALYNRLDEFFPRTLSLPFGFRVHTFNSVMLRILRINLLGPNCLISSNKLLSEAFVHNYEELQVLFSLKIKTQNPFTFATGPLPPQRSPLSPHLPLRRLLLHHKGVRWQRRHAAPRPRSPHLARLERARALAVQGVRAPAPAVAATG